eukprot:CAMPEP_0175031692 /NCGR_PEP_ID=MMETSP0005-20121125/20978_1 /TAXON_ID=420556 /ORGANISM="Ochromonas sp., Strain CCMP1393" /LENGTH=845 /DNA_ID=CAMNT_0016292013 /DNA_START=268 /DNA_END=2805 /DNA_ORIENTATION=-
MAGGVVGVLLPKISLGITLGFSAAMYLCSILLAVRDAASVADFAIYTILFLVSLVISVPLAHKFPNVCASVRTGLVVGFVFALSVDSLIPAHGLRGIFFAVLRMSIKETSLCVGPCLVPILLVLWTLVSLAYMGFSLYEKGILAKLFWGTGGRGSYAVLGQSEGPSGGGIAAAPQQPSPHRQRTFSYPDTLVFNYFDPDSIPEPLVPYAESVFSVVQKLAQQHGFQVDNSRNQAEHLLMLLYNETGSADDVVSRPALRIHRRLFSNYRRWCRHMGVHSNLLKDSSKLNTFENLIEDILMFLLIWGEAANLKHMPECLCFLTHKMMEEHLEITGKHNNNTINSNNDSSNNNSNNNSNGSVTGGGPKRGRYPGFFLDMTVTPLFEVVNEALRASGDHRNHKTYDDFNEFFWTPDCLKYRLHDISDDGSSRSGRSNSSGSGGGSGGDAGDLLLDFRTHDGDFDFDAFAHEAATATASVGGGGGGVDTFFPTAPAVASATAASAAAQQVGESTATTDGTGTQVDGSSNTQVDSQMDTQIDTSPFITAAAALPSTNNASPGYRAFSSTIFSPAAAVDGGGTQSTQATLLNTQPTQLSPRLSQNPPSTAGKKPRLLTAAAAGAGGDSGSAAANSASTAGATASATQQPPRAAWDIDGDDDDFLDRRSMALLSARRANGLDAGIDDDDDDDEMVLFEPVQSNTSGRKKASKKRGLTKVSNKDTNMRSNSGRGAAAVKASSTGSANGRPKKMFGRPRKGAGQEDEDEDIFGTVEETEPPLPSTAGVGGGGACADTGVDGGHIDNNTTHPSSSSGSSSQLKQQNTATAAAGANPKPSSVLAKRSMVIASDDEEE